MKKEARLWIRKSSRILAVFFLLYFVVGLIGLPLGINCLNDGNYSFLGKGFCFITAPVNYSEDFSSVYPNFISGLLLNLGLILFMIWIYDFYNSFYMYTFKSSFPVERVVILGAISTWAASAYLWYMRGYPATGTSIIGFSLVIIIISMIPTDFYSYLTNKKIRKNLSDTLVPHLIIYMGFLPFLISQYQGYFDNLLHIIGGFVFICLMLVLMMPSAISALSNLRKETKYKKDATNKTTPPENPA